MILGIDATNISTGGGLNHLVNLLAGVDINATAFSRVYVWGGSETLSKLESRPWLIPCTDKLLDGNLLARSWWKLRHLTAEVDKKECDLLFVPGGSYTGGFHPFVTMSRNMLPFEWREMRRFGVTGKFLKLFMLRLVQTLTCKKADGIIFLTQYARKEVMKVAGNSGAMLTVIPHGVNRIFLDHPARRLSAEGGLKIIYVSIIDMYKHQWHVIRAVSLLRDKGYRVSVEFIGPAYPPALKKFSKVMKECDPDGQFTSYHGNMPNDKLPEYYAKADICLFASTCENMPNILLEGMASGLPVACSEKPPMPEILGDAGVYFTAEDPESIAQALERLLISPELRARLSEKAGRIAENYSWTTTATATFSFLEQVAEAANNH